MGETWVLLAHLDAAPPQSTVCTRCSVAKELHTAGEAGQLAISGRVDTIPICEQFQAPQPTPGIFCAFIPRAVELLLTESDATTERREREAKRGVTVVAVPDDDRDHQGSVWDKDEESQPELPGVAP